jgi:hypothetical protein
VGLTKDIRVDIETGVSTSVYNDYRRCQFPHAWRWKGERHASRIPVSFFVASVRSEFQPALLFRGSRRSREFSRSACARLKERHGLERQ